jgi:uncharacterized membrane protein
MSVIEEQIEVDVPLRTAYDQWTQFESFPEFMEGVERIEQRTDTMTHWVTKVAGARREFDAQIVNQVPDQQISWRVVDGPKQDGTVMFLPHGADHTVVRLAMDYEPEGITEKVGDIVGLVRGRVKGDLERFKHFIEERGVQTGGWRGQVRPGDQAVPPGYGSEAPGTQAGPGSYSPGGTPEQRPTQPSGPGDRPVDPGQQGTDPWPGRL